MELLATGPVDTNIEIWKDVDGYEGLYKISNCGKIFSYLSNRTLKPTPDKDGYLQIKLSKNKTVKMRKMHHLVAKAFIENPQNYKEINHKDEDKANNNKDNLEWCTRAYNVNYGNCKEKIMNALGKGVIQKDLQNKVIALYPSARAAARATGTHQSNISKCCNKTLKKAFGYKWEYAQ